MEIDITEEVERDIAELESCMLFVDKNRYEIYKLATKKIYHKEHWIKIARSPINKTVQLAKSKKHPEEDYFIETVTQLPQPILQRIAGSESTRWGNIVWLFNLYSNKKVKPYTTLDAMKQQGKVVTEIQKIVDLDRKKYEEEEGQQVPEWHDEYYLEKNEQVISKIKNSNLKTEEKKAQNVAKGKPRNAGLPWTKELKLEVAKLFKSGYTFYELSLHFEKTEGAITSELTHQGIIPESNK